MPNLRLAWAPLTVIVTVAIYLHLRGFPGPGTTSAPAPPFVEELAPAEKTAQSGELRTDDETSAHSGESASQSLGVFAHLGVASSSVAGAPTPETVTSPNRTVAVQRAAHQHPDLVTEVPTVVHRETLAKANALKDQSTALLNLGKRQEALAAITEATDLFRALAVTHPTAFNADLASSLRDLSSRLGDVSRKEEALLAIQEAVLLQRALADERPAEFNAELALSLNHQSNRLSRLNQHEEALLAIQESVDMYRILAEEHPESHKPGLAASLFNLCNRFSKYDLQEEALVAIEEASGLYQELAAGQPATYDRNLSLSLRKLSGCMEGLNRQTPSSSQTAAEFTNPSATRPHTGAIFPPAAPRHDLVAPSGPVFHTTRSGVVTNVAGNYITGDEEPGTHNAPKSSERHTDTLAVAKISRILPYEKGASWDPKLTCLPGTRVAMLSNLAAWSHRTGSKRICWVKDVAGSGKTSVLHTIAQALQREGRLLSSFFFSRGTSSRNNPQTLFPTIARDLANLHPRIAQEIADALEAEPALASASLSRQFDTLILKPSRHLPIDRSFVIVIDALDESIRHDLDTDLLTILRDRAAELPPHVRILIASRPTNIIERYLSGCSHITTHSMDIFSRENKQDIDMYVDAQLRDPAMLLNLNLTSPDEAMLRDLKQLAEGLFIWIVTVCNFLRTAYKAKSKLQALLSKTAQHLPPEKKMDQLYAAILAECGDWEDADFLKDYDLVMGTIMAVKRPISLAALRALHDGSQDLEAEQLLQRFGSVLIGFHDTHQPIRILHLSFHEFVTDRAAHDDSTKHFHLSEKGHSGRLAELCVKTLNRELAKPIAGTGYLAKDEGDAPGIPTIHGASEQLVYGCAHLTSHLQDVERPQTIQAHIITLLSRHLVTWIEVVAATDIFRGSLQIEQWVQRCAPELEHHFEYQYQANAVFTLGNRLAYAARMEESLLATQEAVILLRALARDRPAALNYYLARCLGNMALRLSALGRAREALPAVEEAVSLIRALPAERPAAYNADLAISLNNLSNFLSALGRVQEALPAAEEAVTLRRALAAERPAAYNAHLASSLNNLSIRLSDLGRAQEALPVAEEAVNLRRALATDRPAAYNADLADSLSNLSAYLLGLGRPQEALSVGEEAVNLRRALAAERPAKYNADLASSLSNLSNSISALGRAQEALPGAQEVVNLYRALATERPAAYNASLADSLHNLSTHLFNLGRPQEALSAIEEAVDLWRPLAAELPAAHNADLALSLRDLSRRLVYFGRQDEALIAIPEAVGLYRSLAAEHPAQFNRRLMECLWIMREAMIALGLDVPTEIQQEFSALYSALGPE
ncbi:hypothetical protein HWV62_42054 [Athelia sp. TMB]|nr:hypothetical protein HWV62_42054 [Athelia sp. TMB]